MTDMMRKGAIGIGLAAMMLPLAGCGSKESAEDTATASGEEKSIEDVKREADKLIKPQPGAYAGGFGGEKLLEDFLTNGIRDTVSIVGDGH